MAMSAVEAPDPEVERNRREWIEATLAASAFRQLYN
jgi:hypothetical protein